MTTKDEIATYFQELNIETSNSVLDKCDTIQGREDFCDQWYAFTASNLNGAAPTIEYLEKDASSIVDTYTATTPKELLVTHENKFLGCYSTIKISIEDKNMTKCLKFSQDVFQIGTFKEKQLFLDIDSKRFLKKYSLSELAPAVDQKIYKPILFKLHYFEG
ncbi:hypothetical protein NQ317_003626 [Molorchus minor]|uniref:DNA polymerase alpha subunit B N-terminal domain-containing protein n=1 Tax=Molorchus minor TaxID=1323400 RepID=A0ABQ9JJ45_9CUCU|nr:hypothetical protein NQ317_003626 [Molorchus minor]